MNFNVLSHTSASNGMSTPEADSTCIDEVVRKWVRLTGRYFNGPDFAYRDPLLLSAILMEPFCFENTIDVATEANHLRARHMALTATEFNQCCSRFVDKYSDMSRALQSLEVKRNGYTGWRWIPHSYWPAFSYLTRNVIARRVRNASTTSVPGSSDEEVDLEDELPSIISQKTQEDDLVTVVQFIVYSPTFCVPTFYFLIYDRDGAPLSLEDVVSTSLFKPRAFSRTTVHETYIALEQSKLDPTASVFPLLSQGDHPVLQILCWYFHPCETERAVKELLRERQTEGAPTMGTEQWLETWLLVLSTVVNLEEEAVL